MAAFLPQTRFHHNVPLFGPSPEQSGSSSPSRQAALFRVGSVCRLAHEGCPRPAVPCDLSGPGGPRGSSGRRSTARPGPAGAHQAAGSPPAPARAAVPPRPALRPAPARAPALRPLTPGGLRAGLGRPLGRGRHGHGAAPQPGATSSGPSQPRARPAPGAGRSSRSPRLQRDGRGG